MAILVLLRAWTNALALLKARVACRAAHLYNMRLRCVSTLLIGTAKRMALQTTYQFLEPRAESNYRQLFVRGRSLRAEILCRATIGAEPRTPEEVVADFGVPLAAVHEAVHYCLHNEELLRQDARQCWRIFALGG
jgi:hypothetical protein